MKGQPFSKGEIITKWQQYIVTVENLKIFNSITTGPISTKLGKKHPWIKGIQLCQNEGPHTFPRGDKSEIVKIH